MQHENPFTEEYYLRGPASGLSNYEDYRWLPNQTLPAAKRMMEFLGMRVGESALDFGCARGYYVKALRILGVNCYGYDISRWAIENCDPVVQAVVTNLKAPFGGHYDYVICKDVLEHVWPEELDTIICNLIHSARKAILIIVPLAGDNGQYIGEADQKDVTHRIAWNMNQWLHRLERIARDQGKHHTTVSGCYRVPGLKEASPPFSTAFIRIEHFQIPVDCPIT